MCLTFLYSSAKPMETRDGCTSRLVERSRSKATTYPLGKFRAEVGAERAAGTREAARSEM